MQTRYERAFSQQFVYASSEEPTLIKGDVCLGSTTADPVGATFDEVYNGHSYYAIWNDQFYNDPKIPGCGESCGRFTGHSKGMVAWNENGDGILLQVTTPSWPASGSKEHPRLTQGNTLGCVKTNNVKFSQHFFGLRLTKPDLVKVLMAIQNASVVTMPDNPQLVANGGPGDVQELVDHLGRKSDSTTPTKEILSSGVIVISKPARLNVPPWQMVSAMLDRISLRTATWWSRHKIPTTTLSDTPGCWRDDLGKPGEVEIAESGHWGEQQFSLRGGANHAKIGVSTSPDRFYSVFGDMNQEGALDANANCLTSQNARGGLFFVIEDKNLAAGLQILIQGKTAKSDGSPG
jgi:hypothetical protein